MLSGQYGHKVRIIRDFRPKLIPRTRLPPPPTPRHYPILVFSPVSSSSLKSSAFIERCSCYTSLPRSEELPGRQNPPCHHHRNQVSVLQSSHYRTLELSLTTRNQVMQDVRDRCLYLYCCHRHPPEIQSVFNGKHHRHTLGLPFDCSIKRAVRPFELRVFNGADSCLAQMT